MDSKQKSQNSEVMRFRYEFDDIYLSQLINRERPRKQRPWWHYTLLTIVIGAPICVLVLRMVYR